MGTFQKSCLEVGEAIRLLEPTPPKNFTMSPWNLDSALKEI